MRLIENIWIGELAPCAVIAAPAVPMHIAASDSHALGLVSKALAIECG